MPREKKSRNANGRSSIYLGKDGYWHGRVTVGIRDDGKPDRRHVMRKDKQQVVNKIKELEQERNKGKVRKAGHIWTVEEWLKYWVDNIAAPTVRPNTLVGYRVAVYNHLIPGLGAHKLHKLQPEHLERFYISLREKRLGPASASNQHASTKYIGPCVLHSQKRSDGTTSPRIPPRSHARLESRRRKSCRLLSKKPQRSSKLRRECATERGSLLR